MPTLDWIGKKAVVNHHRKVPYHLLRCDRELSVGDPDAGNLLVQGDNLLALKALLPYYAGKVKCIYIDPPYNTGNEGWVYNDNVNSPEIRQWIETTVGKEAEDLSRHDKWLCMMHPRLALLKELLRDDGILYVSINEKEVHHLRSLLDEIFHPTSFLCIVTVKTSDPSGHKTVNPSPYDQTEYLLMYAKQRSAFKYEQQYVLSVYDPGYNRIVLNRDESFTKWKASGLNQHVAKEMGYGSTREATKQLTKAGFMQAVAAFALDHANAVFQPTAISSDAGAEIVALRDRSMSNTGKVFHFERDGYEDIYVLNGRQMYFYSSKVREVDSVRGPAKPLTNLWTDIPWNGIAAEGGVTLKNGKKPERLIRRCFQIATKPGDLVLDSFAGSGTAGAVAHKMKRQWIMVEMGEHGETLAQARLVRVVAGRDPTGVSAVERWKGGGGFRFCKLGAALFDASGNIAGEVRFGDLAAHVFFTETGVPIPKRPHPRNGDDKSPLLGVHNGKAVYLLFNGVLGDKRPNGGNVLTHKVLDALPAHPCGGGERVIYGEACRIGREALTARGVVFKQLPYEIKVD